LCSASFGGIDLGGVGIDKKARVDSGAMQFACRGGE